MTRIVDWRHRRAMPHNTRTLTIVYTTVVTLLALMASTAVGFRGSYLILIALTWSCLLLARFGPGKWRAVSSLASCLVFIYAVWIRRPPFALFSVYLLWAPVLYAYLIPDAVYATIAGLLIGFPLLWYRDTQPLSVLIGFGLSMAMNIAAWGGAFRLVRYLMAQKEQYRRLSIIDSLTRVWSLNHAMELGQALLGKKRMLAAFVFDLDQFREINDTFGHTTGDEVLAEFAKALETEALRYHPESVTGRLGGDEFVVLVPDRDEGAAAKMAANLRSTLGQAKFHTDPDLEGAPLRFSLGYAAGQAPATVETILHEADHGMYYDKYERDSRWNLFDSDKPQPAPEFLPRLQSLAEKDMYTFVHSQLVSQLTGEFARSLDLDDDVVSDLALAGWLHDFGKILIPSAILRKPGPLTDQEFDLVRRHVNDSLDLLQSLYLSDTAIKAIKLHHERWDGKGYPGGVPGMKTPIEGRIMQITDAFSAMTVKRLYRKPLNIGEALREIERNAGGQFDPELSNAFVTYMLQRRPSEAAAVRQILMPQPATAERG